MSEFIAISDLPSVEDIDVAEIVTQDIPPLSWGFNLPPSLDAERLEVNVSTLMRYHKIGAIAGSLVFEHQGERSEFTPGVSGINADGSAIATKVGHLTRVDRAKPNLLDPVLIPRALHREFGRPIVIHDLNKAELAQRVSSAINDRGMKREQAWAKELDASLRESFRKSAKDNLVNRASSFWRVFDYAFLGQTGLLTAVDSMHGSLSPMPFTYSGVWAFGAGVQALVNKKRLGTTLFSEKRWSMFLNSQSDRYVALNALSRVSRLIRTKK